MSRQACLISEQDFRTKVTLTSFVASFFVVLIHSKNLDVYNISRDQGVFENFVYCFESVVYGSICCFAVPLFFMMSGYLFFRNFELKNLGKKYLSRLRSIVIPYFIWCTLYYIYMVLLTHIPFAAERMQQPPIEISLSEWLRYLWVEQYYTLWFLKDLIIMIVLAPVWYLLLKNRFRFSGWLVFFLVLVGIWRQWIPIYIPISAAYLFGALVGINYKEAPRVSTIIVKVVAYIVLACFLISSIATVLAGRDIGDYADWQVVIACVCIWYAMPDSSKKLPWWCELSFFIYCLHDMILEIIENIWLIVAGKSAVAAILDYLFAPVITIAIVIMIAAFMKKYMKPLWIVLTGGR